jgi:hypothetical protein
MRSAHGGDVPQVVRSAALPAHPDQRMDAWLRPRVGRRTKRHWLTTLGEMVAFCDRHAVAGVARFRALAPAGRARSSAGRNVSRRSKPHRQMPMSTLPNKRGAAGRGRVGRGSARRNKGVGKRPPRGVSVASAPLLFEGAACRKQMSSTPGRRFGWVKQPMTVTRQYRETALTCMSGAALY